MDAEALRELAGAGVEKWAVQARGGQVRDARFRQPEHQPVPRERPAWAALCTRGAGQSGARSCAAPELVALAQPPEMAQKDEAQPLELVGRQKQQLQVELREARRQEEPDAPQEYSRAA